MYHRKTTLKKSNPAPEDTRATKEKGEQIMKKYKIRPGSIADVVRDVLSGLAFSAILISIVYFVSLYA